MTANPPRAAAGRSRLSSVRDIFPALRFRRCAPRLLLAAPALRIHPANEPVCATSRPQVEWELIALTEHWRKEFKVVFRKRSSDEKT